MRLKARQYMGMLLVLSLFWAGAACAEELVIYLSPNGNDKAEGFTQATSVASLQVGIDRALSHARQKHTQLRISVSPGLYMGQQAVTKGSVEGKPLVIAAAENQKERPRFDGAGKGGTWLILNNSIGKATRLTVEGLEISNYVTAISLAGKRTSSGTSNSENVIRNNIFKNIGQIAHPAGKRSTAAIRLVNSDNNIITQNRFENIRNITGCGALHSIYMAHHSSNNQVLENIFEGGCGATIKVRDESSYNIIRGNRFAAQDTSETFLDSYCNHDKRGDCTKETAECPSWENMYEGNQVEMKNSSKKLKPVNAAEADYVPNGCFKPTPGMVRVRESGTKINP